MVTNTEFTYVHKFIVTPNLGFSVTMSNYNF